MAPPSTEEAGAPKQQDGQADNEEPPAHEGTVTEEATICEMLVPSSCEQIYGKGEIVPLHGLQAAGERWLAQAVWGSGFVLFDENGEGASSEPIRLGDLDRAAASLNDIHVATIDIEGIKARRYDLEGIPLGPAFELSRDAASELAIGRTETSSLVVWTTPTRVAARGFTESGPSGEAFELETSVWKDEFHVSIADTGRGEHAVAWSDRRVSDSHHRAFFVRASAYGLKGLPRILIDSLDPHRVVALKKTPRGYALVLEQAGDALLLPLTELGDPDGPPRRFLGLARVHGLAVHESGEMLLAGLREDGRDALRLLDADGAPRDGWKCLEAYPSDEPHIVSLVATAAGFSVLYRSAASQQLFLRMGADP